MKTKAPCEPSDDFLSDLMRAEDVAKRLKVTTKTVRKLCASRRITAIRLQRAWLIPEAALKEYLRDHIQIRF